MKFFAALKIADFAKAAFSAAGLDLEKAQTENKTSVIKDALAANDPETILASAKQENDELNTKLSAAAAKVTDLEGKLAAAQQAAKDLEAVKQGREAISARHTSLVTALDAAGVKVADSDFNAEKPDDTAAALKTKIEGAVTKSARLMVAKAGHPGLVDDIVADGTKKPEAKKPEATGRDRLRVLFQADAIKIYQRERGLGAN